MRRWLGFSERLVPIIVCLPVVVYILLFVGYGLDLTDESSYLNWISDPWLYSLSVTQYGFFYHPIFEFVGGNIALLRGANVLLTIGLASLFGITIFRVSNGENKLPDIGFAVAASLPFGLVAVLYIANWLVTPNYNTLNLQGLLISAIALMLIGGAHNRSASNLSMLGPYVLLGGGGWIVFLAKPPSAVMLAIVALVYLLSVRKFTVTGLLIATGTSIVLLLLTARAIDGDVYRFITRISDATALSSAMDPRYSAASMFRIDKPVLSSGETRLIFGGAIFSAVAIICSVAQSPRKYVVSFALLAVALIVAFLALAGVRSLMPSRWSSEYAIQISSFPLGVVFALLGLFVRRRLSRPASGQLQLATLFITFPYVFAFGSNNNYWSIAANAGLFWVAAAIVLMRAVYRGCGEPRTMLALVLLPFAISVTVLAIGMEYPYRQTQAVRQNDQAVEVGTRGARLTLASDFAGYVRRLQAIAREGGFQSGDPLIDLTGHYPGAPLVLGAIPVGAAWMIGGYTGSEALAAAVLRRVSCDVLATSWLLVEPDGPLAISRATLDEYGMHFETVGSLSSPTGSYPQSYQQYFLRPVHNREGVIQLCEKKRESEQSRPRRKQT
jgi:hypothetical protein